MIFQTRFRVIPKIRIVSVFLLFATSLSAVAVGADPLPSWNQGAARGNIIEFVFAVTDKSGPGYVLPAERIATFGNSDGDLQMLQWTAAGDGKRFMLLVHHTDEQREYAYDKDSHIGKLDKALTEAETGNWTVVDMKKDWKVIYPFEVE